VARRLQRRSVREGGGSDNTLRSWLFIVALFTMTVPCSAGETLIAAQPIGDKRLVAVLASSEMRPLPAAAHVVRLYGIPQDAECIEGTHGICSNDYYLAISTRDDAPTESAYHLGSVGEITEVIALPTVPGVQDRLRITVINYPAAILSAVPTLKRSEHRFELRIREAQLEIRPVQ
jgi:hypothetical protein